MQFRPLGNSGLNVSCLSLGSWLTYEFIPESDALAVISTALDAGINFLDDARYNDRTGKAPLKSGYSEVLFGHLLRQGGWARSDLIIANKLWYEFYPAQTPEQELDSSLARLEMDYLDLAYCAPPPDGLPIPTMVSQLDALIKTGKLRHWGILNWTPAQIQAAYQVAKTENLHAPCAAQLPYSLLDRTVEAPATVHLFLDSGISLVASYTLYGGLLTGKYNSDAQTATGRLQGDSVRSLNEKGALVQVEGVIALACELACTPAQLAIAYCLKNPRVASVLFGATNPAQVQENLAALDLLPRLTPALMTQVQNLLA